MNQFREVRLSELFTPVNGKALYIRSYVDNHPGQHPVLSASLTTAFGYIDTFDFEGNYLTWVMNGYGGRIEVVSGKFSANRDRGVLVPIQDVPTPNLTYLRYVLEPGFLDAAVGRRVDGRKNEYTKLYPPTVAEMSVLLPLTDAGELDYETMETLGARLKRINSAKEDLRSVEMDLRGAEITFDVVGPTKEVFLGDPNRFRLSIGSRVLLSDVTDAGVPIYSANVHRPFGFCASAGAITFDHPSLIWGIDGIYDWNLINKAVEFVPTDHCGRAEILDPALDPTFLLYALRSTRARYGFDRVYRASLGNTRREVSVLVPTTASGDFDFERQQKIATEHGKLLSSKAESLGALDEILTSRLAIQP